MLVHVFSKFYIFVARVKFLKSRLSRDLYHGDDVGIFTRIIYFNLFIQCGIFKWDT